MINIRRGIFETNSSSSHSIVMMKESKPIETDDDGKIDPKWMVDDDGILEFWPAASLDFGRAPFDLLTTWEGRLRYAIAACQGEMEYIDKIKNVCIKHIKGFKDFKFPTNWQGEKEYGYVDHQSMDLLNVFLAKYEITLEDFIFNDRYIVVIDGDEYCIFDAFIKTGMLNNENVQTIMPSTDVRYFE